MTTSRRHREAYLVWTNGSPVSRIVNCQEYIFDNLLRWRPQSSDRVTLYRQFHTHSPASALKWILMTQVFHSGAFIQQCVAVHPLCISLKRFEEQDKIGLYLQLLQDGSPYHRRFRHSLGVDCNGCSRSIGATISRGGCGDSSDVHRRTYSAYAIRELDVIQDRLGLRCATCRRVFDLHTVTFETSQK